MNRNPSPSRERLLPRSSIFALVTALALSLYSFGFRAAGFDWTDALGAASAHVLPGAVAATFALSIQPRIHARKATARFGLHVVAAIITAVSWLALMLFVTWLARPGILTDVIPAAGPGTLLSGLIVYAVVVLVYDVIDRRQRSAVRDAALARAQLAALRAKVEPHFLYNTLETISALVSKQPEMAQDAIMRLGRMLRRVLDEPLVTQADDLLPLSEEMMLVRDYLAIEMLRMGDRLRIEEYISEDCFTLAVPPFTLQTLAENAVIHGIAPRSGQSTLSVTAAREGRQLVLVVADDGVGTCDERLENGGMGLTLLKSRLDAHFPGLSSVDVASEPGYGTSVRISIPAMEVE